MTRFVVFRCVLVHRLKEINIFSNVHIKFLVAKIRFYWISKFSHLFIFFSFLTYVIIKKTLEVAKYNKYFVVTFIFFTSEKFYVKLIITIKNNLLWAFLITNCWTAFYCPTPCWKLTFEISISIFWNVTTVAL